MQTKSSVRFINSFGVEDKLSVGDYVYCLDGPTHTREDATYTRAKINKIIFGKDHVYFYTNRGTSLFTFPRLRLDACIRQIFNR